MSPGGGRRIFSEATTTPALRRGISSALALLPFLVCCGLVSPAPALTRRARWAAGIFIASLASLALLPPEPARAQTSSTLISNTGQTNGGTGGSTLDHAQAFTTGSNSAGYKLTAVQINFSALPNYTNWEVGIWSDTSGSPNSKIATLTDPTATGAGVKTFIASGNGVDLDASTTYHIVIDSSISSGIHWDLHT